MKRVLLFIFALVSAMQLSAQCNELFLSGYVEGYGNNRALEIYNPTNTAINLSGYSVGRFSNGSATPSSFEGIQLPGDMIGPYSTYVVVVDKRDSTGTGFETPVWNGYQLWDVLIDQVTGEPVLDMDGDTIYSVQYDGDGLHLYGDEYHEWLDLEGKADVFLCPVYAVNNAMYFNGNDAVALISGTEVMIDGSNIIDVIGVIGEDPGESWVTSTGQWITKDKSLTRNADVTGGSGIVAAALGDTIAYENWDISFKNDFSGLEEHECACAGPVATNDINQIPFKMYPNPLSANELNLESDEKFEELIVYNMLGMQVFTSNLSGLSQRATVNLPDLNTGLYTVAILFEGNRQSIQKLMITK